MKPRISILSPEFKYRDSARTDIRATFARIRREQRQAVEREQAAIVEQRQKVRELIRGRG